MTIKDGKITKIEGGPEAKWLDKSMKKMLAAGDENANHLAEFLIELNPNAEVTCYKRSLMDDERQLGGFNIGWGRETHFGGTFDSKFHVDGYIINATVVLDNIIIIQNGVFTIGTI